jgi:hypothetical protein
VEERVVSVDVDGSLFLSAKLAKGCVCVLERERQRERDRAREIERESV